MSLQKLFRLMLVVAIAGMFVGCEDIVDSSEIDETGAELETATDAADTTEDSEDSTDVSSGNSTFLWKPVAETRGGVCVVIFPYYIRHEDTTYTISINGDTGQLKDWREGYANGNRIHVFLNKQGSAYGGAVTVSLPMADGTTRTWSVPDGGTRFETQATGL